MTADEYKKKAVKSLCSHCDNRLGCTFNDKQKFYFIDFSNIRPCKYMSKDGKEDYELYR